MVEKSLELSDEQMEGAERLAQAIGVPVDEFIRDALSFHMAREQRRSQAPPDATRYREERDRALATLWAVQARARAA